MTRRHPAVVAGAGDGPDRATTTASTSSGQAPAPTWWHVTDRADSAAVTASATHGRSLTTAHDCTGPPPSSPGEASANRPAKRGLPPPLVAWPASAGAKAFGSTVSSNRGREAAPAVRTTSRNRGSSINAISEPPANTIRPLHHPKRAPAR